MIFLFVHFSSLYCSIMPVLFFAKWGNKCECRVLENFLCSLYCMMLIIVCDYPLVLNEFTDSWRVLNEPPQQHCRGCPQLQWRKGFNCKFKYATFFNHDLRFLCFSDSDRDLLLFRFCCIYLGLAGFCIKGNRVVLMGVSITFQLGQFILRVLLLSLKLIHLPMIQRKCKRISSP